MDKRLETLARNMRGTATVRTCRTINGDTQFEARLTVPNVAHNILGHGPQPYAAIIDAYVSLCAYAGLPVVL